MNLPVRKGHYFKREKNRKIKLRGFMEIFF